MTGMPDMRPPHSRATRRSARDPVQARHGERAAARARAAGSRLRPAWVPGAGHRGVQPGKAEGRPRRPVRAHLHPEDDRVDLRAAPAHRPGRQRHGPAPGPAPRNPAPSPPRASSRPAAKCRDRTATPPRSAAPPASSRSLHPPYPRTRGSPGCVPGRSPGIQPEPGWGNWHAATARGQPGRHHPGRLAVRDPRGLARGDRPSDAGKPGRSTACSRQACPLGGCDHPVAAFLGRSHPGPGSDPRIRPAGRARKHRRAESLLPASPATRLLPCRLCTNMWITCAQRRRACAYAVEMLGIPLPGRNHERAFTWENASSILCIQRKPELSTCRAVIDNK